MSSGEEQPRVAAGIEHYIFETEEKSLPDFTVLEFTGREGISQLAHFDIKLLCPNTNISFSDVVGKRASLRIWCWQDGDYSRVYHGIISTLEQIGQASDYAVFRAVLVPSLWRSTMSYQSRIYQEMSIPDIVDDVLGNAGLLAGDDYKFLLQGTYPPINQPPREFCVQYRESDFNFISRLMENEGIFYFFEYNDDKEVMVIADSNSAFQQTSPLNEIMFEEPSGLQSPEEEYIHPLSYRESVLPSTFMLKDYNYNTPQTDLSAQSQLTAREFQYVYDYPGGYGALDQGAVLARVRNEENEAKWKIISGGSNCRSLCAGHRFTLTSPPREDIAGDCLLTNVSHHGVQGGPLATDVKTSYNNEFVCIPADTIYRPPRVTPKARVQGTQTATVVGPGGEELYMDEKGRAKVQFHWDLSGQRDERSSCWVRVSHGYAGQDHGIQFHPLVNDEVIVDFLEGDPDRPIIVGSVYNGTNMPPLSPDNRIQNIVLTPYQHRLIFDDRGSSITINTGGSQTVNMADGGENSDYGNCITISTSDGHTIRLAGGQELKGIKLQTSDGHYISLEDPAQQIHFQTVGGHAGDFDDNDQHIGFQTSGGHRIVLSDAENRIGIQTNADRRMVLNDADGAIGVINDDGDMLLRASGKITIEASEIELKTGDNYNVKLDSQGIIEVNGTEIYINGELSVKIVGGMAIIEGGIINIAADGPNVIEGTPITLNS